MEVEIEEVAGKVGFLGVLALTGDWTGICRAAQGSAVHDQGCVSVGMPILGCRRLDFLFISTTPHIVLDRYKSTTTTLYLTASPPAAVQICTQNQD